MIAQVPVPTPSGAELMVWLGCLAFVFMLINQGGKVMDRVRGKKTELTQPLEVRAAVEFVRAEECRGRHEANVGRIDAMNNKLIELETQRGEDLRIAAASRREIYKKIEAAQNDMAGKLEKVRDDVSEHTESVRKELSDKLDDMPERMIATLKNTGAI